LPILTQLATFYGWKYCKTHTPVTIKAPLFALVRRGFQL